MPQPQHPKHKSTTGRLQGVPCPWCEYPNDFRPLVGEDQAGGAGWGDQGLERGARMQCDNPECSRFFKILQVEKVTVIKLVPCP